LKNDIKTGVYVHYELTAVGELLLAWVLSANMAININKLAFGRK
jgi:hypothetical protein